MAIVQRYKRDELTMFPKMLGEVVLALELEPSDVPGPTFHDLELRNKWNSSPPTCSATFVDEIEAVTIMELYSAYFRSGKSTAHSLSGISSTYLVPSCMKDANTNGIPSESIGSGPSVI